MKCICGYEEPEYWEEKVSVYYQSGKRKGELKEYRTIEHPVPDEDKFIEIKIEKEFSFVVKEPTYYTDSERSVCLYACPKCSTVRVSL